MKTASVPKTELEKGKRTRGRASKGEAYPRQSLKRASGPCSLRKRHRLHPLRPGGATGPPGRPTEQRAGERYLKSTPDRRATVIILEIMVVIIIIMIIISRKRRIR